jgi:hypothetical protein
MPCALTSEADYPDYLKSILNEIEAGNDEALKACACSLKTPTTNGGCPILGEDNKVGAFPFCLTYIEEDTSSVGDGTNYPLKLSLKDAMNLYWSSFRFENDITYSVNADKKIRTNHLRDPSCNCITTQTYSNNAKYIPKDFSKGSKKIKQNIGTNDEINTATWKLNEKKDLVCQNFINFFYSGDTRSSVAGNFGTCLGPPPQSYANSSIISEELSPLLTFFQDGNSQLKIIKIGGKYWFYPKVHFGLFTYGLYVSNDLNAISEAVSVDTHEYADAPIESVLVNLYFDKIFMGEMRIYIFKFQSLIGVPCGYYKINSYFNIKDINIYSQKNEP